MPLACVFLTRLPTLFRYPSSLLISKYRLRLLFSAVCEDHRSVLPCPTLEKCEPEPSRLHMSVTEQRPKAEPRARVSRGQTSSSRPGQLATRLPWDKAVRVNASKSRPPRSISQDQMLSSVFTTLFPTVALRNQPAEMGKDKVPNLQSRTRDSWKWLMRNVRPN